MATTMWWGNRPPEQAQSGCAVAGLTGDHLPHDRRWVPRNQIGRVGGPSTCPAYSMTLETGPRIPAMAVAFLRLCGLSTVEPDDRESVTLLAPSDLAEAAQLWPHIVPTGDYGLQRDFTASISMDHAEVGHQGLWRMADLPHYRWWCEATGAEPADPQAWQQYPGVATIASDSPRSAYAIPLAYHMARMASAIAIKENVDPITLMEASDGTWSLFRRTAGIAISRYGLLLAYVTRDPADPIDDGPVGCELQICSPAADDPYGSIRFLDAAEGAAARVAVVVGLGHQVDLGIIAFRRNVEMVEMQERRAPGSWYQFRINDNQLRATTLGTTGDSLVFPDNDGPWASGVLVSGDALALLRTARLQEPSA